MRSVSLILTAKIFLLFVVGLAVHSTVFASQDIEVVPHEYNFGDIEVVPLEYDFGNVELGTSKIAIVTITNVGFYDVTVSSSDLLPSSSEDFSVVSAPSLPVTLPPVDLDTTGGTVDIEISYTPLVAGYFSAVLEIVSDDEIQYVTLSGTGVEGIPDIEVYPYTDLNFGDVEIGYSRALIITIANMGYGDLIVDLINLSASSSLDFSISTSLELPDTILPGVTIDIEITYVPSAVGYDYAELYIFCNDPTLPQVPVIIQIVGSGVIEGPPQDEQIEAILQFFDGSVVAGTLVGDGPGNLGEGRLGALRNMIEAAGNLIVADDYEQACQQLGDICNRIDGLPRPLDFVAGKDSAAFVRMILDLMAILKCCSTRHSD
jgi:hypothetical protein